LIEYGIYNVRELSELEINETSEDKIVTLSSHNSIDLIRSLINLLVSELLIVSNKDKDKVEPKPILNNRSP
jgi:hypothetical protein